MTDDTELVLMRRFEAAQRLWGRVWLHSHVHFQRLRAFWLVSAAELGKRSLDIVVSLLFLILLSPLFAVIATAVWIEDGGPVFFAQSAQHFAREWKRERHRQGA